MQGPEQVIYARLATLAHCTFLSHSLDLCLRFLLFFFVRYVVYAARDPERERECCARDVMMMKRRSARGR